MSDRDIVAELRDAVLYEGSGELADVSDLPKQAADEIERLRTTLLKVSRLAVNNDKQMLSLLRQRENGAYMHTVFGDGNQ